MLQFDILDRKIGVSPTGAVQADYAEKDFPAAFPYARWTQQLQRYNEYWAWFYGTVWDETIPGAEDKAKNPVLRFPLQINMIQSACMKHAYVLFGEVPDGPNPLVPCKVRPEPSDEDEPPDPEVKKRAKQLQKYINKVWAESNGRTLQLEGGTIDQFLGGHVFKLVYDPFNTDYETGLKIELVLPDFFMPVWETGNPDNLLEAFIVWRVPAREAKLLYDSDETAPATDYQMMVEHWTKDTINITLGGKPLSRTFETRDKLTGEVIDTVTQKYENMKNPFGFVPMVYIPAERAGSYYGISKIDSLRGLAKEYNARTSDLGDVIKETSHRNTFVRNTSGSIRTRDIGGIRNVIDLGQQISNNHDKPDAFTVDPPKMPDGLVNYPEILRKQYLRDGFLSAVADGEDEGSQRSALTLAFRMWPLTSKARVGRMYWTIGLNRLNRMIARIAAYHNLGDITPEHLEGVQFFCDWSPMVPRDREQLVTEVISLLQSESLAPVDALRILGTVDDEWEAVENLKEWLEYKSQQEADSNAQQMEQKAKMQSAFKPPTASSTKTN